ncbi:vacuolar protein sorting-associated protein VTA1 homolog isoform X2 [Micropterus salmoides]|nr:vacuolar protein sorting-associated protein VTA1 homolog isoform X2 [Micropterus salmoides]
MFHIVVFDNTNEVEVVPSVWIENGECMWPPNKIDVAKAVKSQECPGDGWMPHKARIIFTSHDYNEARLKLPQAVDHTDLGSDGGDLPIKFKRKRIRKNILFPGEDDDEMESTLKVTLPNAPKIPRQYKTPTLKPGKQGQNLQPSGNSSPDFPPSGNSSPDFPPSGNSSPDFPPSGNSSPDFPPSGNSSPEPSPSQHSCTSKFPSSCHTNTENRTPRHASTESRRTPRHASTESRRTPRHASTESRRTPRHASTESRRTPRHASTESRRSPRHTERSILPSRHPEAHQTREQTSSLQTSLLRSILTKQEMMMDQLRIIFKTLQGMKATDEAEIGLDRNLLPVKDVSSLQNLEEQLQSIPDLQKQLVNTLALKGGTDIRECVWRIMHAMITNSLAKNINMRGINGKIGFQRLQIRDVVIAAVRRNRLTSGATDQEIDSTIKRWLHLAPDRDGGRRERMRRKEREESRTAVNNLMN